MPALQIGAVWPEERHLGALRQFVPQNGRVHLQIIDKGAEKVSCGETVVQKGVFGESVSSLPP